MKKFLALLLLGAMMFALCACGNQPATEVTENEPTEVVVETTETGEESAEWATILDEYEAWVDNEYLPVVKKYTNNGEGPMVEEYKAEYERFNAEDDARFDKILELHSKYLNDEAFNKRYEEVWAKYLESLDFYSGAINYYFE